MYRKFENSIPPKTKISISSHDKELFDPPRKGDTVTFKVAEHIYFGVLVECVESDSIKGEVSILGGVDVLKGQYESYKDWALGDKIEIALDRLDGIIKK